MHDITASANPPPQSRTLICAGCGTTLSCTLSRDCWCAAETARLPLPAKGSTNDCLCRDCLRKKASAQE